ncbi:acyl-CoA thioesterase [Aestuariirhabdus litorea]|uniref:Acyl-CoA thioesterase n=1 Tax=Aestuariirhabdus litorea TaxID=2528527 RepID=A0A3P3VLA7_9GAMM|nr:hotdog domain-containing protein [Aestuariirhabdus litorea]RRJ82509.1 acyl-CoA thioesterase [Aestuariirhabdus litorea]RWW92670.1 acyl-CoA thioesterase [Endozoicomonadaceae bacterium GTF-13]
MNDIEDNPRPNGQLCLQIQAMPRDTNPEGAIYSGWLVSQMDLAAAMLARRATNGRVATVSMESMAFMVPVSIGDCLGFYGEVVGQGRSSLTIRIEVWKPSREDANELCKVTDGSIVLVAIDERGRTRPIPA